jgi:hypothetical protein
MKPGPQFALLALSLLVWTTPSAALDGPQGCVTQTLSLLAYIDDNQGSAANLNQNILPPPPTTEAPDNTGRPPEPAPTPLPPPASVDCPTLYLRASDTRAQAACRMASDLPGARCRLTWSGLTLVIEPFD